jgi:hypothetical protein
MGGPTGERLVDCRAVTPVRRFPWWLALLLVAIGLGSLYGDALRTGFLNDDYLFIEEARSHPVTESLTRLGALGNYYRPLSRQLYFAALTPLAGGSPLVFHLVNAVAFAVALALLVDLLLAFLPLSGTLAGALYFALLPLQRVNLIWVSCSQDLFALVLTLAAVALFRRGRDGWACLAYLGALASKEVAWPLPVVLAAWAWRSRSAGGSAVAPPSARALVRRMAPFAITASLWLAVVLAVRARNPLAAAYLHWAPVNFLAALVHEIQSLIGLDHPGGMAGSLALHPPPLLPLIALGALALWLTPDRVPPAAGTEAPPSGGHPDPGAPAFAALWLVAFGLPVGPVVHTWSGYYYTIAAVGGALVVGLLLRRIDRWGWIGLVAGLLWWHAGGSGTRAFGVSDRPWGWTSHLTTFYFQRGAALTDSLRRELRERVPAPPRGTRFFFASLPPWAGFQSGNGPLIRDLYRDSTLASHFYSQFSDSTAGDQPCRFLYWDGVSFAPLYGAAPEPWFQVGSDLLLFDRPSGAAHAFGRGLRAGEGRRDHLYWLGWADLWRDRRHEAEVAWEAFGARDDPHGYDAEMMAARDALLSGDSLSTRRHLFAAIRCGIGRPDAHGALGELLERQQLKYALLELKVATFLNPRDLRARRHLFAGLVEVRLDDAARRELDALVRLDPSRDSDSTVARARRTLDRRSGTGMTVMEF